MNDTDTTILQNRHSGRNPFAATNPVSSIQRTRYTDRHNGLNCLRGVSHESS